MYWINVISLCNISQTNTKQILKEILMYEYILGNKVVLFHTFCTKI